MGTTIDCAYMYFKTDEAIKFLVDQNNVSCLPHISSFSKRKTLSRFFVCSIKHCLSKSAPSTYAFAAQIAAIKPYQLTSYGQKLNFYGNTLSMPINHLQSVVNRFQR